MSLREALVAVLVATDLAHQRSSRFPTDETVLLTALQLFFILVRAAPVMIINGILVVALLEALVAVKEPISTGIRTGKTDLLRFEPHTNHARREPGALERVLVEIIHVPFGVGLLDPDLRGASRSTRVVSISA